MAISQHQFMSCASTNYISSSFSSIQNYKIFQIKTKKQYFFNYNDEFFKNHNV